VAMSGRFPQPRVVMAFGIHPGTAHDRLAVSLQRAVDSHPALRTYFDVAPELNGSLRERILESAFHSGVPVKGLHRRRIATAASLAIAHRHCDERLDSSVRRSFLPLIASDAAVPFDLRTPPLAKAVVLTDSAGACVLVVIADQLIADMTSLAALADDLGPDAHSNGSVGDRGTRSSDALTFMALKSRRQTKYWQRVWQSGIEPVSCDDLPIALPRPELRSGQLDVSQHTLPTELADRLASCARRHGVGAETVWLAAVAGALHGATRRIPLTFWVRCGASSLTPSRPAYPSTTRHVVTLEIGAGKMSPAELLRQAIQASATLQGHQAVPIELVWMRMRRCLETRHSQICFQYSDTSRVSPDRRQVVAWRAPVADFDGRDALQIQAWQDECHSVLSVTYVRDRFSVQAAASILGAVIGRLIDLVDI
jgi:hypothetical protein